MRKVNHAFIRAEYMERAQVSVDGKTLTVGSGNDDNIKVYRDKENYYVLSENSRMNYICLERFNRETLELEFDFSMESDSEEIDWLLKLNRYPTKINYLLQWDM